MATPDVSSGGSASPSAPARDQPPERAGFERQRARLIEAIVEIVSSGGYARMSIGELARRAGVSRGTFYELFSDKEECFLEAFAEHEGRLRDRIGAAAQRWSEHAIEGLAGELVSFANEHPEAYDFLFHEALLAGRRSSVCRDSLARWILEQAREREAQAGEHQPLDAPTELILGAVLRLLTMRIKRGSLDAHALRGELTGWIATYRSEDGASRWGRYEPVRELMREPAQPPESLVLRKPVPKGRHGLSSEALRALHRERIAYGTALAIHRKGYAETTVTDIVACAGVSRDVFYAEFRDKHEAFNEAAKLVFEQLLATMASSYYGSSASWPERVWGAGEAFARFLEDNPALAHFLFVGTSAPQPQVDRVNEYVLAFRVFIEDGAQHRSPVAPALPAVATEALVCAVLAAVTFQIREDRIWELRGLIPTIVYTVTVPFLGRDEARSFIDARVSRAIATP